MKGRVASIFIELRDHNFAHNIMKEKLSVHRLLSLKKTTENRISLAILNAKFIDVCQGQKKEINGIPIINIEREIKANYEKINHLINNYIRIKSALLTSNADIRDNSNIVKVTVAGKEYTMAELIDMSDHVYGNKKYHGAFKECLLNALKKAYATAIEKVKRINSKVEKDIKDYLLKATNSNKIFSNEDIVKRSNMFHEDEDAHLVDPLNIKHLIDNLEEEIKDFRIDCDATISEQNALTIVEVEVNNIR